ncbi:MULTISPECIES: hypothetical protein [Cyanophyceae]|nr:hypothetical protein [Trichocoleus sp. FACHB-40]
MNRWKNGRTRPLAIVLKQIEAQLRAMGDWGIDLLGQYFPKSVPLEQELR